MTIKDKIKETLENAKIDTRIYTLSELSIKLSQRLGTEVKQDELSKILKEMEKEVLPANDANVASKDKSASKKEQITAALGAIDTTSKTAAQVNVELGKAGIVISEGTCIKYLKETNRDFVKGGGESKSAKIEIVLAENKELLEGQELKDAVAVVEAAVGTVSAGTVAKYAEKVGIKLVGAAHAAGVESKSAKISAAIEENREKYLATVAGDPKGGYKTIAAELATIVGEEVAISSIKTRLLPKEEKVAEASESAE